MAPDGKFDLEHIDFIELLHDCNTNDAYEPIFLASDLYEIGIRYIDDIDARDRHAVATALYHAGLDLELAALTTYKMKKWQAPGCAGRERRSARPSAAYPPAAAAAQHTMR